MMSRSWIALCVFILVVVLSIPLMRLFVFTPQEHAERPMMILQEFELGDGRQVDVLGSVMRNQAQAFYYAVLEDDRLVSGPHFFASLPAGYPELLFTVHAPEGVSMVAVAAEPDADAVLAMYDFEDGTAWPSQHHQDHPQAYQERGRAMFERLEAAHPAAEYRFVRAESTRPLQVLIDLGYEFPDVPDDARRSPLYD